MAHLNTFFWRFALRVVFFNARRCRSFGIRGHLLLGACLLVCFAFLFVLGLGSFGGRYVAVIRSPRPSAAELTRGVRRPRRPKLASVLLTQYICEYWLARPVHTTVSRSHIFPLAIMNLCVVAKTFPSAKQTKQNIYIYIYMYIYIL